MVFMMYVVFVYLPSIQLTRIYSGLRKPTLSTKSIWTMQIGACFANITSSEMVRSRPDRIYTHAHTSYRR